MSMCRVFSCVVGRGCLLWPGHSLDKTLLAFALLHYVLQDQTCLLLQISLDFLLLRSSPLWWKRHLLWVLVLEGLVGLHQIRSDQSLSRVRLFATPWIAARQVSLSITNSQSSLRLTSIKSVMPSIHLILCRPLLLLPPSLPASESFPMRQLFAWGGQSTGVSALASFLPKKSQGWSP